MSLLAEICMPVVLKTPERIVCPCAFVTTTVEAVVRSGTVWPSLVFSSSSFSSVERKPRSPIFTPSTKTERMVPTGRLTRSTSTLKSRRPVSLRKRAWPEGVSPPMGAPARRASMRSRPLESGVGIGAGPGRGRVGAERAGDDGRARRVGDDDARARVDLRHGLAVFGLELQLAAVEASTRPRCVPTNDVINEDAEHGARGQVHVFDADAELAPVRLDGELRVAAAARCR